MWQSYDKIVKMIMVLDLLKEKREFGNNHRLWDGVMHITRIMLLLYTETSGQAFVVFVNVVGMAVLVGNKSQGTWYICHCPHVSFVTFLGWILSPYFFILYFYSFFYIYKKIMWVQYFFILSNTFFFSFYIKKKSHYRFRLRGLSTER